MALRLIEIVSFQITGEEIKSLLRDRPIVDLREAPAASGEVAVRLLIEAEQSEPVLDLLEQRYGGRAGFRIVVFPIEATLPALAAKPPPQEEKPPESPERISRQELYEDINEAARCTGVYLAMVVLSSVVAAIGLYHNSVAIIIGAMVIAPLLGPNVALSLATALGDLPLARRAVLTGIAGIGVAIALSTLIGAVVRVNPALSEVAARTQVDAGDAVLALAAGCAGTLAFTTGASATLIGVMVAVALMPPLVTFGLLLGGGHFDTACGALALFLLNLICINLAGVTTFVVRGIHPAKWWEKERAKKAIRIAIGLWTLLLAALAGIILLVNQLKL
jgi:uncharacterized hydrophobic protein (TIGR00341 family)